jgi:hypothetical protein
MTRVPHRVPDVVQREIAGETFLVPVRGHLADLQELFVLNEVGSWVWAHLDGVTSLDDLATSLVAEYEVDTSQARRDIGAFLEELHAAGLAQPAPERE